MKWVQEHFDSEFKIQAEKEYDLIQPEKSEKQPLDTLLLTIKALIASDKIKILVMNGKNDIESSEYSSGCNFVIGGNTLGRGVTFPGLQTIYYTRTSKKPQADTMWQHSRMFGYDRDPGMMMIYIDEKLYKLFS